MFIRHDPLVTSDPVCSKAVDNLEPSDFQYFDKDGFELNIAEQKFYSAMGYPIHERILNHTCWQVTWYTVNEQQAQGMFLDHSMLLQRCSYVGEARQQIEEIAKTVPQASLLLQVRPKWGFDFDLNAVAPDGTVYEVLHIEYDTNDYNDFRNRTVLFEQTVKFRNWHGVAEEIWQQRDQWQHLKGYDQNHWKANYILGWKQSEYIEKAI